MSKECESAKGNIGLSHPDLVGQVCHSVSLQDVVDRDGALELSFGLHPRYSGGFAVAAAREVQKFSRGVDCNHAASSRAAGMARRRNQGSNQLKNCCRSSSVTKVKRALTGWMAARISAASSNLRRSRA